MKKFLHNNGLWIVIIAALLAAVMAVGSSILGYDPISGVINAAGAPFRAAASTVSGWVVDLRDRSLRYDELAAENQQLRQQISELEQAADRGEDALRENERLRDLLKLSQRRPEFRFVDAVVTGRSSSTWCSDLTLNQGSDQGVAPNNCVVDQQGNLVGVVSEVGPNWALVSTILDPDTRLGGRIPRTDDSVILEGNFSLMQEGLFALTYLDIDSKATVGDRVLTSDLGGLYPANLPVGTIRSLHTDADGISRYALLTPKADIQTLRYAYIITEY